MEMELVKRYTYAVTQKLPEAQRADIDQELRGLIEDMLEDRTQGREATEKDVEAVLLELGSPTVLADKYRGYQRYLIGPELFPVYQNILKIVFMAVAIAMLVVFSIQTILNPPEVLDHFVNTLATFLSASFQAFAWVTVVFGVIESTGVEKGKIARETAESWTLADLPALPENDTRIGRAEPIISIILTVLFVALVTFSIGYFGLWVFREGQPTVVIPFLNETVFRGFLPFIWALTALTVSYEAIRLVTRKSTLALIAYDGLIKILNFTLALFMFSDRAIWNPNFMTEMVQSGLTTAGSEGYQTVSLMWNQFTGYFIYFIGVVFAIEMITTAVRAFRMRNPAWKGQTSHPAAD